MFAHVHKLPLFETSAQGDGKADHVEFTFMTLAHKVKNSKPMMPVHMFMWESDRDHFISDGSVYAMLRYVYTHRDTKPCLQACHK